MPLTGYRFTCTLNTFMKIEMRIDALLHERRLVDLGDHHDLAVGRRDDETLAALAGPLRVAEEVRDPERDQRQREREQPERPGAPDERDAERAGGDERRDDDEAQAFAGEVHE